ncbi:hypothetical protein PG995_005234 [Apiospora arundinis]
MSPFCEPVGCELWTFGHRNVYLRRKSRSIRSGAPGRRQTDAQELFRRLEDQLFDEFTVDTTVTTEHDANKAENENDDENEEEEKDCEMDYMGSANDGCNGS